MHVTPELLQYLCDPVTKEPLELRDPTYDERGRIVTGSLVAPSGTAYPIVAGIPRFVEGDPLGETVESFGDEWNYFNFTSFKAHWLEHIVEPTFGSPKAFEGKLIVDAGGGSGAHTLWMLESGARHVILLELSHSVDDVIRRNLEPSGFTNYDVVQCTIDAPPLRPRSIDGMVLCFNVIQHTPSIPRTARALFDLVAPGGEFAFNAYRRNDEGLVRRARFALNNAVRAILSKRSWGTRLAYARIVGALRLVPGLGWLLEKANLSYQGNVPRQGGTWDHLRARYRATVLNTFDWFGAHAFQHYPSDEELRALVHTLQPNDAKVHNTDRYFMRPPPAGIGLRVVR